MIRSTLTIGIGLVLGVLSGCAGSPQAKFYTLSPLAPAVSDGASARVSGATAAPVTITIATVNVPEIVDKPQIMVRTSANEVTFDEFARWADPLKSQIRRVSAADLALQFSEAFVSGYPGSADASSTYQVSLDLQSFDSTMGDQVHESIIWSIRPPKGALITGRSNVSEPTGGDGYDMLVAAHSRILAHVTSDIAAAIRTNLNR